jgi:archaellin
MEHQMKWILQSIIIISTSGLTAIITYEYTHSEYSLKNIENTKASSIIKNNHSCHFEKTPLDSTNSLSKKEPVLTSKIISNTTNSDLNSANDHNKSSISDLNEEEISHKIYQRIEAQQRHIKTMQTFAASQQGNHNQILQGKFDNEEIDYAWSSTQEDKIYNLFDTNPLLNQISPNSVSCKSKNCQIVIPMNDPSQLNKLYSSIRESSIAIDNGQSYESLSYFIEPNSGQLTMYLSRPEHNNLFK